MGTNLEMPYLLHFSLAHACSKMHTNRLMMYWWLINNYGTRLEFDAHPGQETAPIREYQWWHPGYLRQGKDNRQQEHSIKEGVKLVMPSSPAFIDIEFRSPIPFQMWFAQNIVLCCPSTYRNWASLEFKHKTYGGISARVCASSCTVW